MSRPARAPGTASRPAWAPAQKKHKRTKGRKNEGSGPRHLPASAAVMTQTARRTRIAKAPANRTADAAARTMALSRIQCRGKKNGNGAEKGGSNALAARTSPPSRLPACPPPPPRHQPDPTRRRQGHLGAVKDTIRRAKTTRQPTCSWMRCDGDTWPDARRWVGRSDDGGEGAVGRTGRR